MRIRKSGNDFKSPQFPNLQAQTFDKSSVCYWLMRALHLCNHPNQNPQNSRIDRTRDSVMQLSLIL